MQPADQQPVTRLPLPYLILAALVILSVLSRLWLML